MIKKNKICHTNILIISLEVIIFEVLTLYKIGLVLNILIYYYCF